MTTALSFLSGRQITNDSGTVQAGAKLYTYREGTTTALTVWTDDAASVAHANPIVCDAGGFVPLIYVDDTFDYKVVIKTSADVTLKTYDNIPAPDPASTTGYFPTLLTWITKTRSPAVKHRQLRRAACHARRKHCYLCWLAALPTMRRHRALRLRR